MNEMPALMPFSMAADVLRLSVANVEFAVAAGELPVVYRDGTAYVVSRQLFIELGVSADHPDLPLGLDGTVGTAS